MITGQEPYLLMKLHFNSSETLLNIGIRVQGLLAQYQRIELRYLLGEDFVLRVKQVSFVLKIWVNEIRAPARLCIPKLLRNKSFDATNQHFVLTFHYIMLADS